MSFYFDDDNDDQVFSQPFRSLLQQPSQTQTHSHSQHSQSQTPTRSKMQSQSQSQSSGPRSQVTFSQAMDSVLSFRSPQPANSLHSKSSSLSLSQSLTPKLETLHNHDAFQQQQQSFRSNNPTFVCQNCGAVDDYYKDEAAGGVLTCSHCFTQSQAFHAPEEEFDYEESQNMAVRNRDGTFKTVTKLRTASAVRNPDGTLRRGRPPVPLEDCDFTVRPPPLGDCLEGLGTVLRRSCKIVCLELIGLAAKRSATIKTTTKKTKTKTTTSDETSDGESNGSSDDSNNSSDDGSENNEPPPLSETQQRRELYKMVSATVKDLWKAYLWSWKEGADQYSSLYPEIRFCLRDAFLGIGLQRVLFHTLAARARATLLDQVRVAPVSDTFSDDESDDGSEESDNDNESDSNSNSNSNSNIGNESDDEANAPNNRGHVTDSDATSDVEGDDDDEDEDEDYFAAFRNRKKRIKLEQEDGQQNRNHSTETETETETELEIKPEPQSQPSELDTLANLFDQTTDKKRCRKTSKRKSKDKTKKKRKHKRNSKRKNKRKTGEPDLPVPDVVCSRGISRSDSNAPSTTTVSNAEDEEEDHDHELDSDNDSDNDNDNDNNNNNNDRAPMGNENKTDDGTLNTVASDLSVMDGLAPLARFQDRNRPKSKSAPSSSVLRKRKRTREQESGKAYTNNVIAKLLLFHHKMLAKEKQKQKQGGSNKRTRDPLLGRREAALLLRPSLGLVAGILLVATAPHGVTEKQMVDWIENGSLPLLRAGEELLSDNQRKSLKMVAPFFSLPTVPTAAGLRQLAKRIHVACGYTPPTVKLVPPPPINININTNIHIKNEDKGDAVVPPAIPSATTTLRRSSRLSSVVSPDPVGSSATRRNQHRMKRRRRRTTEKILTTKNLYVPGRLVRPSTVPLLLGKLVSELGFSQIVLNYALALTGLSVSREALPPAGNANDNGNDNGNDRGNGGGVAGDAPWLVPDDYVEEEQLQAEPECASTTSSVSSEEDSPVKADPPAPWCPPNDKDEEEDEEEPKDDLALRLKNWRDYATRFRGDPNPPVYDLTIPEELLKHKEYQKRMNTRYRVWKCMAKKRAAKGKMPPFTDDTSDRAYQPPPSEWDDHVRPVFDLTRPEERKRLSRYRKKVRNRKYVAAARAKKGLPPKRIDFTPYIREGESIPDVDPNNPEDMKRLHRFFRVLNCRRQWAQGHLTVRGNPKPRKARKARNDDNKEEDSNESNNENNNGSNDDNNDDKENKNGNEEDNEDKNCNIEDNVDNDGNKEDDEDENGNKDDNKEDESALTPREKRAQRRLRLKAAANTRYSDRQRKDSDGDNEDDEDRDDDNDDNEDAEPSADKQTLLEGKDYGMNDQDRVKDNDASAETPTLLQTTFAPKSIDKNETTTNTESDTDTDYESDYESQEDEEEVVDEEDQDAITRWDGRKRAFPKTSNPRVVHKRRRTWLPSPILGARPDRLGDLNRILAVVVVACKLIPDWDQNHRYRFARDLSTTQTSGSGTGNASRPASTSHRSADRFVPWNQKHFSFIGNGKTEKDYLDFLEEFVFHGTNYALPKFVESLTESSDCTTAGGDGYYPIPNDDDSSSGSGSGNSDGKAEEHNSYGAAVIPNDTVLGWTSPRDDVTEGSCTATIRPPRVDQVPYRLTTNADINGLRTLDSPLGSLIEYIAYKTGARPHLILKHLIQLDRELGAKYAKRSRKRTDVVAVPPAQIYNELLVGNTKKKRENKKKTKETRRNDRTNDRRKQYKTPVRKRSSTEDNVRVPNNILLESFSPIQFDDVLTQRAPEMEELLSVGEIESV